MREQRAKLAGRAGRVTAERVGQLRGRWTAGSGPRAAAPSRPTRPAAAASTSGRAAPARPAISIGKARKKTAAPNPMEREGSPLRWGRLANRAGGPFRLRGGRGRGRRPSVEQATALNDGAHDVAHQVLQPPAGHPATEAERAAERRGARPGLVHLVVEPLVGQAPEHQHVGDSGVGVHQALRPGARGTATASTFSANGDALEAGELLDAAAPRARGRTSRHRERPGRPRRSPPPGCRGGRLPPVRLAPGTPAAVRA